MNDNKVILSLKAAFAYLGLGLFLIYALWFSDSFNVSDSYILFLAVSVLASWAGFNVPGIRYVSIATPFFAIVAYLEFGLLPSATLFAISNAFGFNSDRARKNILYRVGASVLIVFIAHLAYGLFRGGGVYGRFDTQAFVAFLSVYFVSASLFDALGRLGLQESKNLDVRFASVLGANLLATIFAGSFAACFVILYEVKPVVSIFALVGVALLIVVASFFANRKERSLEADLEQTRRSTGELIEVLSAVIEAKDKHDWGHVLRVRAYSLGLAKKLALFSEREMKGLALAALLHDIGKIAIPEALLLRHGSISPDEFERVKNHSVVGAELLHSVSVDFPLSRVIRHHHERWDGTGYPDGLAKESIPIFSRIIAVADVYDSLCSPRPFRPAYSRSAAIQMLRDEAGKKLDPNLVDVFLSNLNELEKETMQDGRAKELLSRSSSDGVLITQMSALKAISEMTSETIVLHEIGELVEKSLDFDRVVNHLLGALARRVDADAYLVYLFSEGRKWLEARFASVKKYPELVGNRLEVGEGVTGWSVKNRQPLYNVYPGPDFANLKDFRHQLKSGLIIPLKSHRQILGAVAIYSEKPYAFEREQIAIAKKLALASASVMLNAMEFDQTVKESLTDPLTELPNLRALREFFEEELVKKRTACAILMIDMDDLKWINDNFGHPAGDESLKRVAGAIRTELRADDICFRYGGDEFVAVIRSVDRVGFDALVKRLKDRVASVVLNVEGRSLSPSVSIGVAFFPQDSDNPYTVLSMADSAMYSDKRAVH